MIAGFITASGVLIAASQLKHVLGVEAEGHSLIELGLSLVQHAPDTARKHGLDPTAMSIAWTLTRPFDVMPIVGATSVQQLQHSLDGETLTLAPEVLKELGAAYKAHAMPF